MGYYRETQTTYMGKRASWYINRATVALSEADIPEIFYGNDIILTLTPDRCLVLTGAGGTLAVLDDLSAGSVCKMKEMLAEGRRRLVHD